MSGFSPPGNADAVTIGDGANTVEGATTDAALTSNTAGTLSGKLRGLVAILADVWDSTVHVLKFGGIYNSTRPTLATGNRAEMQAGATGALVVQLAIPDSTGNFVGSTPADGLSNTGSRLSVNSGAQIYNGTSWDRQRGVTVIKTRADASVTAGTGATVWTPAAGKKPRIIKFCLSLSVAGQIILLDNVIGGTELLRSPQLQAGAVWSEDFIGADPPLIVASANNVIKLDVTGTGNVGGWIGGVEE